MKPLILTLILMAIFYLIWLAIPWLKRRAQQAMARKMEDYLRRSMGMPPREKQSRRHRNPFTSQQTQTHQSRRYTSHRSGPVIPPEYAEDVEYTEFKDFSSSTTISHDKDKVSYKLQEQVSDVQWVEIKDKNKKA